MDRSLRLADATTSRDASARSARPAGAGGDPEHARDPEAGLQPEARLQRALELGYRHLARRDRTEAELRSHLGARGLDDHAIDGAVEALARQGYLDDARYVRTFVEDRRALDGWGSDRIQRRLLALGVAGDLVRDALAERDPEAELDDALAQLRRRFDVAPRTDRERGRALALLARKGYDAELAHDAISAFERAGRAPT